VTKPKLIRAHAPLSSWLQWGLLLSVVLGSIKLATLHVGIAFGLEYKLAALLAVAAVYLLYPRFGIFSCFRPLVGSVVAITLAWCFTSGLLFGVLQLLGSDAAFGTDFLLAAFVIALVGQQLLVIVFQFAFRMRRMQSSGVPVLIVGSGRLAEHLRWGIERNPYLPDQVIGFIDDADNQAGQALIRAPRLGGIDDLAWVLERSAAEKIYIALPLAETHRVEAIYSTAANQNIDVIWSPDVLSLELLNPGLRELSGVPMLAMCESPLNRIGAAYIKSLLDVVISAVAILVLSPLLLLIAATIRLSSPGPVIYRQERHGWDGTIFEIWKFRSMRLHNEDGNRVTQATQNDPRVTMIGRVLRRSSLDELPQLFNVLAGTMSLVGPRPHAVAHNYEYADQINSYMKRHRIKPGITGWAQVNGLRGETNTLDKMSRRVSFDLEYINRWSPWLDFWILVRTPFALFGRNGAY